MNVVCPFDKTHTIPVGGLQKHIEKCKSPNKHNFQRCKYNPDHWINFSKIKQHQKQCSQQQQAISSQIEPSEDSVIESIVKALDSSQSEKSIEMEIQNMRKQEEAKQKMMKKKRKKEKEPEYDSKPILWTEPSFKQWMLENPNVTSVLNGNSSSDSESENRSTQNHRIMRYKRY